MLLQVLRDRPGYAKVSLQGPQGSGKSRTAIEIAVFLHSFFKSTKPIAFYDTEAGSDYLAELVTERTGMDPLRVKTRGFSQLLEVVDECRRGASDILVVDSITHVWREIQAAYMQRVNEGLRFKKTRMDIQDIMRIKEEWAPWPDEFLTSPLHVIVCGREGNEWGHEENEETGKRELIAVGKKMKVEGEFGYEASLMISMHAEQIEAITLKREEKLTPAQKKAGKRAKVTREKRPRTIINVATVLKDRFDELNGVRFEMPTGESFLPFIKKLTPANHVGVDTRVQSTESLPEMDGSYIRVKTDREILVEKVQGELLRAYPGQTAMEKQARNNAFQQYFDTRSWTEIEKRIPLARLQSGYESLRKFVDDLERVQQAPPAATEDDVKALFDRITELSTALLKGGKSQADVTSYYKEAAGVDGLQWIKAEHYPAVIARLETEQATLKQPKPRAGRKSLIAGNAAS